MQISIFHFSLRSWIDKISKYTYIQHTRKFIEVYTEFSVSQIKLFRIAGENVFPKRCTYVGTLAGVYNVYKCLLRTYNYSSLHK